MQTNPYSDYSGKKASPKKPPTEIHEVEVFTPRGGPIFPVFTEDSIDPEDVLVVAEKNEIETLYFMVILTNGAPLLVSVNEMFVHLPRFDPDDPSPQGDVISRANLTDVALQQFKKGNTVYRFNSVKSMLVFLTDKI